MAKRRTTPRRERRRPADYMTGDEARAFMDRWAADQNETVRARRNVRNLIDDFIEYAEDAGVDFDRVAVRPMMEQYLRHAKYGLSKWKSAKTRSSRTVEHRHVLTRFDALRPRFSSDSATADDIAARRETFKDKKGNNVTLSRNTILEYVNDRKKGLVPRDDVT